MSVTIPPVGDMKAARNARESAAVARPRMSILQRHGMIHGVRATEYGADKYARGNYFGPAPAGLDPVDQYLEYVDAAIRHLTHVSQAINVAKGTGGDQRAACAVVDEDMSGAFPPSLLPHVSHTIAGLMIAVEVGVANGLLPADPGQPWKQHPIYLEVLERRHGPKTKAPHDRRGHDTAAAKDDPDAERARVESLRAEVRADAAARVKEIP